MSRGRRLLSRERVWPTSLPQLAGPLARSGKKTGRKPRVVTIETVPQEETSTGYCKILHIEPNEADARWFELVLHETAVPNRLLRFASVVQAANMLRAEAELCADLVILSWRLPYMSAQEALQRLRAIDCLANVPILITVAAAHERDLVQGASGFLYKPVDTQQLERMAEQFWGDGERKSSAGAP